ncbi:ferritin-like domain-containing protein [Uliginosibacterium sp. 31-12]|uniref:ferritin-like domain-containing protein n=1 Tax=Uliginosibacterium sp. 31-12 TaxID=3062781 RepID=UPI0026E274B9|nr:ferritin-like domain-containing protein [Uliginosibacterium sp. 31-12]MDO6387031.1 ferritin-like domain-containing protein [Uliginosibacterium sp. 31-12]
MPELRQLALAALATASPDAKCAALRAIAPDCALDTAALLQPATPLPGREARPQLVMPRDVPQRALSSPAGRAALIHALAHIELNAVNLALDIVWRFAGMPAAFYRDWLGVAREEADHFELLRAHLASLGHAYGDFPAHNGLWEMAAKTSDSLLARLALVPRMLEARGLDVSPAIRAKLIGAGDMRGAEILDVILRDEIGHVAIGNRWFKHLCEAAGRDPLEAFASLARNYSANLPRGPFNLEARRAAGFSEAELIALQQAHHS